MTSTDRERMAVVVGGIIHPGEVDRFVARAVATETTELAGLATRVANYLHEVETASHAQPTVDVDLARQVGRSLIELLDGRHYDATQRALLRGAVEYFVLDDDEQSDLDDVVGFDDDARVFNAVAAALGRDDLVVQPG